MKFKILIVINTNIEENDISFNNYIINNLDSADIRICTIGPKIVKATTIYEYNYNIHQNNYTYSKWISLTNEIINNIFDDFIPDLVVLNNYNLTSVGAGIAAYFIGTQIHLFEPLLIDETLISCFPMDRGFEILLNLVDFHFCSKNENIKILENYKIHNCKQARNYILGNYIKET